MTRMVRVGDIAKQYRGVTFGKADAVARPQEGYVPVLRAGNIQEGRLDLSDLVYVPAQRVRPFQFVRKDDVVITASSGSLDVVGKAARSQLDFDGGFGAFLKVLRPGPSVDPSYFAYFFQTAFYRRRVSALAAGANINNLRNEHLDELQIPMPTIEEQQRIVAILDRADTLRSNHRQVAAHLRSLTQSIFEHFFAVPASSVVPLGEIAEKVVVGHVGPTSEHFRPSGIPFLRTGNVGHGEVVRSDLAYVTKEFHRSLRKSQLSGGDVLISRVITNKIRAAILPLDFDGANCANIILVRPSKSILAETILGFLGLSTTQKVLLGRRVGSAQGVVNTTVLKELLVPVYSVETQDELVRRIASVARHRALAERNLEIAGELISALHRRAFDEGP